MVEEEGEEDVKRGRTNPPNPPPTGEDGT